MARERLTPDELKAWRKAHNLTQAQLAALLGIHELTISQWETGGAQPSPFLHLALETLDRRLKQKR